MARHRLTSLRTYEEASQKEKSTAPIRGRTPECKPIGDRRDTHFTIRKEADGSIVARCYRSDLIRWYPDGRIFITNGGYASQTTHDFISRVISRNYALCFGYDGKTWIKSGSDYTVYPLAKGGQYFTRHAAGYLVAETPNYAVTHVINRPAMQAARKEIAPFTKYFNNMMKLTQWAPPEEASDKALYSRLLRNNQQVLALMQSNDTEQWAQVMEYLVWCGARDDRDYRQDPQTGQYKWTTLRYIAKSAIQEKITHTLLATHRSKLLTKRTHTTGGWVKDAYKDYADD